MKSYADGARDAVNEARKHLGYRETPSNRTIFGKRYGWDGVAWCVQFAWYCGDVTGSDGGVFKTASTGAAMRHAKSIGRWRTEPQPGDWSIMVNSRGATIHTDLVESYNPSRKELICIGGNTSGSFNGSVNEGNGVYRNNRWSKWKNGRILGFYRPLYGISADEMKAVQRAVGVSADGVYGAGTLRAVKAWQASHGLTADGFPGPATYAAMTGGAAPTPSPTPAPVIDSAKPTSGALEVDGVLGRATAQEIQQRLGVTVDGRIGPDTIKAWQAHERTPVDGKITGQNSYCKGKWPAARSDCFVIGTGGSRLIRTVQTNLNRGGAGLKVDGLAGDSFVKALQRALNESEGTLR